MWKGRNRKSPRLKGFDYASDGAYFVTVKCHGGQPLFGEIADGEMRLNELGDVVFWEWLKSEEIRKEIVLDEFVIMPNHFHGVIFICQPEDEHQTADPAVGTKGQLSLHAPQRRLGGGRRSLSSMMGGFKLASTIKINALRGTPRVPVWQGRFHDQIIRDEDHLNNVRQYITTNPANWATDEENI